MHRSLYTALAALALMFAAAPAQGYELDRADKRVPLPTRDWRFLQQQCDQFQDDPGLVGCAYEGWDEWTDIYGAKVPGQLGEVQEPKGMGASTYWHETGHLFDFTVLTDAQRNEFLRLTKQTGVPWWPESSSTETNWDNYDPPAERFADAYSICALRATGRRKLVGASVVPLTFRDNRVIWRDVVMDGGYYGYKVKWPVHQRICQLIANAGGRNYDRATGAMVER